MHTYTMVIGDWSNDGHGKTDTFHVETSHASQDILTAYKKTEKITKLSLIGTPKCKQLFEEYEDDSIHVDDYNKLKELGVNFDDMELAAECLEYPDEYGGVSFSARDAARLFLEFARVSLPELTYKFIEPEELINGIGYGLYH